MVELHSKSRYRTTPVSKEEVRMADAFTAAVEFVRKMQESYGLLAESHQELLVRDLANLLRSWDQSGD